MRLMNQRHIPLILEIPIVREQAYTASLLNSLHITERITLNMMVVLNVFLKRTVVNAVIKNLYTDGMVNMLVVLS